MNDDEKGLTLQDLRAVYSALDSWIDAFSDDEEFDEEVERVKKVVQRIDRVIKTAERESKSYLRLVKPEDVN